MICICVGARPNFIKAAPIIRELVKQNIPYKLVHTGQHFDGNMSADFFWDLELPKPDINLNSNLLDSGQMIPYILLAFTTYLKETKPSIVVVLGDVDSSLACALAANKAGFKVAHVEAGERSGDRSMPEEINRILIDELSDILFFSSYQAADRFSQHPKGYLTGNVMIDQLRHDEHKLAEFAVSAEPYAVLTLHRQSNVDDYNQFEKIYKVVLEISEKIPVYFPAHPRTKESLRKAKIIWGTKNIIVIPPQPRLQFLAMVESAKFVMTDSGGLQVETSYLNVPCLTLRDRTEWLDTIQNGTNALIDPNEIDKSLIWSHVDMILHGVWKKSKFRSYSINNGKAAEMIAGILKKEIIE